jgi:hypothetical protein
MSYPHPIHAQLSSALTQSGASATTAYPLILEHTPDLFGISLPTATVTISIATPAEVAWTNHGLLAGDVVWFTTTGALPTGLTASTPYYVIAAGLGASVFRVSASLGDAAINTSGTQSGVQTCVCINKIVLPIRGDYHCTLSWMVRNTAASDNNIDVWVELEGAAVTESNTRCRLTANGEIQVAAIALFVDTTVVNSGLRIFYCVSAATIELYSLAAQVTPTRPVAPSMAVAITYQGR